MKYAGLIKTTFREIKHSFGRYIAILAIIALGVGFFSGLKVTRSAMLNTGNKYLTEQNLFDYRLVSTLGFNESNINSLKKADSVEYAEGSISQDAIFTVTETEKYTVSVNTITKNVNKLDLIDGRLPESNNECVVDSRFFRKDVIGKVLTLSKENGNAINDKFKATEFKVVGIVQSPTYLNFERGTTTIGDGKINGFIYINSDGFDMDYYTQIYLSLKDNAFIFSDEYKNIIDSTRSEITALTEQAANERYSTIKTDSQTTLSEKEKEFNTNNAEYETKKANTNKKLKDALNKLNTSKAELTTKEADLKTTKNTLIENKTKVEEGLDTIKTKRNELLVKEESALDTFSQQETILNNNKTATENALKAIEGMGLTDKENEYKAQLVAINDGITKLKTEKEKTVLAFTTGKKELTTKETELKVDLEKINTGLEEVNKGEEKIANGKKELEKGYTEYNKNKSIAETEFAKAETELNKGKEKIEQAKKDIEKIEKPTTYVLGRDTNIGYVAFESDTSIVDGIADVFPLFFLLVATLVCMTTMNRMIDEQRGQIGILKALGYKNNAILFKYMTYSGSAAILGVLLGFFGGSILFPKTIWMAYNMMYGFKPLQITFSLNLGIISLLAALVCSAGTTFASCYGELRNVSADLIRPKSPKSGKRIFLEKIGFLWKRLNFLHKVSIRNIFRYKKRFIMMVIGIAGCTALLVTGFGIKDSISKVVTQQYDEIQIYNYDVAFKEPLTDKSKTEFKNKISSYADEPLYVYNASVDLSKNGKTMNLSLVVPDDTTKFSNYIDLHTKKEKIAFPKTNETVISKKTADIYKISVGDNITITDGVHNEIKLKVSGICENYIYNYIYIDKDTFKQQLNKNLEFKNALINGKDGKTPGEIIDAISSTEMTSAITDLSQFKTRMDSSMKSMDYIVLLVIACAGALAFIVLYNLTNINITERIREIATIKVLGFTPKETSAYVFREGFVLTAIGAIVGLILGHFLHQFVMAQIKIDLVSFDVHVTILSYILSIVLTFVFAAIVNIFMYFKLEKINMAESLKSIE